MNVFLFLVVYIVVTTIIPVYLHFSTFSVLNVYHILLTLFNTLNSLIAVWEIGLGLFITHIQKDYNLLKEKYRKNNFKAVVDFMFAPMNFADMVSLKFWTKVWSTYSLYDPSYANRESFGFFVDVGNGWTTLVPSILFIMSMTFDLLLPRTLGIMGVIMFYQEFYGTVIYFLSFIFNKRYVGKSLTEVFAFVGISNGLWFFFPLLGLYISINFILSDSLSIVRI